MGKLIFQQDEVPALGSQMMQRFAKFLWEIKEEWHRARRPQEAKWRQCDDAYLCRRYLPDTGAIDFLDDGEFGETDVHDAVNLTAMSLTQRLLSNKMPYLETSSEEEEPEQDAHAVRDYLIYKHRQSRSRRIVAKFLKGLMVRGDYALAWEHREEYRMRRLSTAESAARIADYLEVAGFAQGEEAKQFGRARVKETIYCGPHLRVVDSHDYFMNPIADLTHLRREPVIIQTYRFLHELVNEVDDYGDKVYGNLKGLEGMQAYDIYAREHNGNARLRSLEVMGIQPETDSQYSRLIPVYVCYFPYIEFEGYEFYDTYFHFALNNGTKGERTGPRMIRVEENPLDSGHLQFLPETYMDFFTNISAGISGVEKSLTALRQKDVMQALMFNAAVASQFPAYLMVADALKDNEACFSPGYVMEVAAIGTPIDKILAPVPAPTTGLQLALQDLRFMADEIRSKMGIDGLSPDTSSRSITKSKTATEVQRDTASGSLVLDEHAEKFTDVLSEYFQGSFEMMKQRLDPTEVNALSYERRDGGRMITSKLAYDVFMRDRSIRITGQTGAYSKDQRLQSILQALDMLGRAGQFLPNAPAITSDLVKAAFVLMSVPISKNAFMTPEQLAAMDPQVQMQAIQMGIQQIAQSGMAGPIGIGGPTQPQEEATDVEVID